MSANEAGLGLKPPRELKAIFDEDTGTFYLDLTEVTKLMVLVEFWNRTMRNQFP